MRGTVHGTGHGRRATGRALLPIVLLALAALLVPGVGQGTARADAGPDLVVNGNFRDGTTGWGWLPTVTASASDGRLNADVQGGTQIFYDAVINQQHLALRAHTTYCLGFTASASVPTRIVTKEMVVTPQPPYPNLLVENTDLTPRPHHFSYRFTTGDAVPNSAISFQVGGYPNAWQFHVTDVTLRTS